MNPPTMSKQVRAFLGLVGYYRKFIKGFAKIAKPLTLLTRQQVKFEWTPEHQAALVHLKDAIVQAPILHYPNPNKTYIIYTDASDDACGAHLSQEHDGTKISCSIFITYLFQNTTQMEHYQAGSLWSILHGNQMELLPPGSQHNCPE